MIRLFGHLYAPDYRGLSLVTVVDGRVATVESATEPTPGALGGFSARILPGLLDMQVNGAFGEDFSDAHAGIEGICRAMPQFGITAFVPTVITSPKSAYPPALANLRRPHQAGEARILGVHIEGPFISPKHAGTHDPAQLRLPDCEEVSSWLSAGDVRLVTLAPELPGALELIQFLVDRGVYVSIGHTDATWDQAEAAVRAGASLATHLFNAMRPFRHRDPGVVGYTLASGLRAGFIADGNHVAFGTMRFVARAKAPEELILVTDALAGLGMPPGRHMLAGREYISDGTCGRLPDGTLSGSLLPLNRALRNLVERVGLDPAIAVQMATLNPARALGLESAYGRVEPGRAGDLVVVDEEWEVLATLVGGIVAFRAGLGSATSFAAG